MIWTAIMGFGTIGSGIAEVLDINRQGIASATGKELGLRYILDLREFPDSPYSGLLVHDIGKILDDSEIKIVFEAMGGVNPAYQFTRQCLEAGKHVVTSNKAVVEAKGTELLEIARNHEVNYFFEASVGGGIPLIRPLTTSLSGERILEISGILNGTTNYILTKMNQEGETFERALRHAQELGYAEKNPEADVEGHDTGRKISILTALATGKETRFEDIYCEGMTSITPEDFLYARKLHRSVKLLGTARLGGDAPSVYVCPVMVEESSPLYSVSDVYNGVMINGKTLGRVMFYGSGAGKLPTANACVSDAVEILGCLDHHKPFGWGKERQAIRPFEKEKFRYFIRFGGDYEEMLEDVRAAFGPSELVRVPELEDEFAVLTEAISESRYRRMAAAFGEIRQRIRCQETGVR